MILDIGGKEEVDNDTSKTNEDTIDESLIHWFNDSCSIKDLETNDIEITPF